MGRMMDDQNSQLSEKSMKLYNISFCYGLVATAADDLTSSFIQSRVSNRENSTDLFVLQQELTIQKCIESCTDLIVKINDLEKIYTKLKIEYKRSLQRNLEFTNENNRLEQRPSWLRQPVANKIDTISNQCSHYSTNSAIKKIEEIIRSRFDFVKFKINLKKIYISLYLQANDLMEKNDKLMCENRKLNDINDNLKKKNKILAQEKTSKLMKTLGFHIPFPPKSKAPSENSATSRFSRHFL